MLVCKNCSAEFMLPLCREIASALGRKYECKTNSQYRDLDPINLHFNFTNLYIAVIVS